VKTKKKKTGFGNKKRTHDAELKVCFRTCAGQTQRGHQEDSNANLKVSIRPLGNVVPNHINPYTPTRVNPFFLILIKY
jgi:hypothetical protein